MASMSWRLWRSRRGRGWLSTAITLSRLYLGLLGRQRAGLHSILAAVINMPWPEKAAPSSMRPLKDLIHHHDSGTITGWYAEFEDLTLPPGSVGYAKDAGRFMGATFDPSGLYRFNAVQRMLVDQDLTTELISEHVRALQRRFLNAFPDTALADAELLNPVDDGPHARFLAFRSPNAQRWHEQLKAKNCITDVRGDVLRIGFGLYQDEADVDGLVTLLGNVD